MGRVGHLLAILFGIALAMPAVSLAQADVAEVGAPQTAWGAQKSLSGVWNYSTLTPVERYSGMVDKLELAEKEAATFSESQFRLENLDLIDSAEGGLNYVPS